jgi:hypothetical protein
MSRQRFVGGHIVDPHNALMEEFIAEIRFRFPAESLTAAGSHLNKLSLVARTAGFEMESGKVVSAPPPDVHREGGTGTEYAPLPPDD